MWKGNIKLEAYEMAQLNHTWLAIVNPMAGFPLSKQRQETLIDRLRCELGAEVIVTPNCVHAADVVTAARDVTSLAVFGGDGTLAEVVNRMDLTHQRLLPMYGGTGNGLARDLGLTTWDRSFSAVHFGHTRNVDVMQITLLSHGKTAKRLAISIAAFGYAADTAFTAKRLSRPLGSMRYLLAMILRGLPAETFELSMEMDGKILHEAYTSTVMVNNTRHAGNFSLFRNASLHDRRMNVLLTRGSIWSQILDGLSVPGKNQKYETRMELSTQALSLRVNPPLKFMIDGDMWENVTEVDFEFLPEKLTCFAGNM
jgi:diacylglycerol kinase family enzyme